ncbi:uncharacterized protein LOC126981467 [Eriocheir sinensis]|uniref:uncharacterized protein LOC126981467 n=1 Tax=Eriocheir sinensis TaxID=95602 RepID=UPI0021C79E2C|nr:uncharacterized protein LOC126981467 [Eriocheir sinensis]
MEKFLKPTKKLKLHNDSFKKVKAPAPAKDTPQEPRKQDEGSSDARDTLLCVEGGDGRRVTCWRPGSPYRLRGGGAKYVSPRQVVVAVPQGATRSPEGRWSLQPVTLNKLRLTSLKVMMAGHPLEGVLLSVLLHSREEEAALEVDFQSAIDYLRDFYETGMHLLEIVEDDTRATTRFLVGSWQDPRMPDLPLYRPGVAGGPWVRDAISGNHKFLETVRSYHSDRRLPHDLEFFLSVSSEQRARLEELCTGKTMDDPQDP